MNEYVTLMGAEQVARAGSDIAAAADTINRATGYMAESVSQFKQTANGLQESLDSATQAMTGLTTAIEKLVAMGNEMRADYHKQNPAQR